jgi:pimeloyl-ACP methyl ester carboxylesterase
MAGVAPYDAAGLDFTAGMGEDNVREFDASVAGPAALEAYLRPAAAPLVDATGDAIVAELATLLPTVDRDLLTGEAGEHLAAEMRWSLSTGIWGWFDDDIAFVNPWGCALDDIVRPISVLQGTDDLMVPFAHGEWLAGHLPTAQAHLLSGEGHLSLINHVEVRVRELRSWLDER